MPRKRLDVKTTTRQYSLENMHLAADDIKNGRLTFGKASVKYGIPKTTLYKQVKLGLSKVPKLGRYTVFTEDQEEQLAKHILNSEHSNEITGTYLRKVAFKFAEAHELNHNFNREKQMAGKDWFYNFMSRHPDVSMKISKSTSQKRKAPLNSEKVPEVKVENDDGEATISSSSSGRTGASHEVENHEIQIKRSNSSDDLNNTGEIDIGTDSLEESNYFEQNKENNLEFTEHEEFVRSIVNLISDLPFQEAMELRRKIHTLACKEREKYFDKKRLSSQETQCENEDISPDIDISFVKVEHFSEYYENEDNN